MNRKPRRSDGETSERREGFNRTDSSGQALGEAAWAQTKAWESESREMKMLYAEPL
jgi:hypothetical protein